MRNYILRRVLLIFPVMWMVATIVFFSIRVIPGDVIDANMTETMWLTKDQIQELRKQLGIDTPAHVQYVRWIGKVVQGDLGRSFRTGEPVAKQIGKRFPVTFELAMLSIVVAILFALPIGIISAVRQDTWMDYTGRLIAIGGLSVPNFIWASMIIVFPSIWFHWVPPLGFRTFFEDPAANFQQMFPAAFALGAQLSATSMRMTRSTMLEVLREDYVRTAWAKGLRERVVIMRHALKNSLIPVITMWGTSFGYLLGGTVIIESIFGLPGIGSLTVQALWERDYPQLQGNVLFLATSFVVMNLIVDLLYGFFDPRIRYQ